MKLGPTSDRKLGRSDEAPVRPASVGDFWMDETPVTNAEFARFVAATGHVTFAEMAPHPRDYPAWTRRSRNPAPSSSVRRQDPCRCTIPLPSGASCWGRRRRPLGRAAPRQLVTYSDVRRSAWAPEQTNSDLRSFVEQGGGSRLRSAAQMGFERAESGDLWPEAPKHRRIHRSGHPVDAGLHKHRSIPPGVRLRFVAPAPA